MTCRFFLILLAICLLGGCASSPSAVASPWSLMLAASREADPDFPDGDRSELTRFALLGCVRTEDGPLHVVEVRWRLTGMDAPRGYRKLSFFSADSVYVGSQRCGRTEPMICRGPYVLMWGSEFVGDQVGNAWDLSGGFGERRLVALAEGF